MWSKRYTVVMRMNPTLSSTTTVDGDDPDDDPEHDRPCRHDGGADGLVVDRGHHGVDGVQGTVGQVVGEAVIGHRHRLVAGGRNSGPARCSTTPTVLGPVWEPTTGPSCTETSG